MPRSSNSCPGWAKRTTEARRRRDHSRSVGPDDRDPLDVAVVGALAMLPGARELDLAEVLRERPDRRADRHLVVVDDDEHLGLALADVVERLQGEAAHQRGVADDDRDPLEAVADVARLGQALGHGQPGAGMAAVEDVMGRLGPPREPADPVELAQGPEALEAAGQQLVRVGLVAGVPHDPVARRLEQAMERDRQLDDAQRRAEVAAGVRDGRDDRLADLQRELGELDLVEPAQVGGSGEVRQDGHGRGTPSGRGARGECKPVHCRSLVSAACATAGCASSITGTRGRAAS